MRNLLKSPFYFCSGSGTLGKSGEEVFLLLSRVCCLVQGGGRGPGEGRAWCLLKHGWALGDPLCPHGLCRPLPWRALVCACGVDFSCLSLRIPLRTGENFGPVRKRQPGQPDYVHGFSGWHLFEPNHVANVSYTHGGREKK